MTLTAFKKTFYGQIQTPTGYNPRLAAALTNASPQTIVLTQGILTNSGVAPATDVIFGIKHRDTGYTCYCYVTAANISSDGTILTNAILGLQRSSESGTDLTTSYAANIPSGGFPQDSSVRVIDAEMVYEMMADALQGSIASGGNSWQIGDGTAGTKTVYAANGGANQPYFQFNNGSSQWVYSNDGVSSTPFGTGAGITAGGGLDLTAGVMSVKLTDTTKFINASAGVGSAGLGIIANASGLLDTTFLPTTFQLKTAYAAKGDILVGTAANTDTNLSVGSNGQALVADSTQATGLKYQTNGLGSSFHQFNSVSISTATNTDTVVNCGFTAKGIKVQMFYNINNTAAINGGQEVYYNGSNFSYCWTVNPSTYSAEAYIYNNPSYNINGGGSNYYQFTLSIISLTASGFTFRIASTISGSPPGAANFYLGFSVIG